MTAAPHVLVTLPGKLGDLIYALPAVIQIGRHFGGPVSLQTSELCRPALGLLTVQPYLHQCFVDPDYVLEHVRYGCQPWRMSEPPGYDAILHLGFRRELLGASIMTRPLRETYFLVLEHEYGLSLPGPAQVPYLFLEEEPMEDIVVFQGYGETLMDHLGPEERQRLLAFWHRLFEGLGLDVRIVTGPRERSFYDGWGYPVVCPDDLLETARLIARARCFLGVQSAAAAVA
ncbi:MAG: hypothetical protein KKB20_21345, partial [Proteobacteria bacterium]|nr:hypothetical protein [Pseudomonadota bacterium]